MRTVALDLGARKITYCEIRDGSVVARGTVSRLDELIPILGPNTPAARVAFEACREGWHVNDRLEQWGHQPLMLDTTRVRQLGIGHHKRKTDSIDAEVLARALERGQVPLAHVLSPHRRSLREQLSVRSALVETRTQYVNTARGLARAAGTSIARCDPENFVAHARSAALDERTRGTIEPLLTILEQIQMQLRLVEERLEALCRTEPVIARLATVPFVGLITAATFVAAIDDAGRFHDSHGVQAYLGLVPSTYQSGDKSRIGRITKAGNRWARVMLVQSAWSLMARGPASDPLTCWARNLAERRNKLVAAIALARRLAGVLWAIWRRDAVYDPMQVGLRSARGFQQKALAAEAQASDLETIARAPQHAIERAHKKIYRAARPARRNRVNGGAATT